MTACMDCRRTAPMLGYLRCECCHEVALLQQARAILAGSDRIVTKDHLRALDRVIAAQAAAIHELQGVLVGRSEVGA